MNILYLDIETDGLPLQKYSSSPNNYPNILQISYSLNRNKIDNYYLKYKNAGNMKEFYSKHITLELLEKEGLEYKDFIKIIIPILNKTNYIISHNIEFDVNTLFSFLHKNKAFKKIFLDIKTICTMNLGRYITKIILFNEYKYPSLEELYKCILNKEMNENKKHNSIYDTECLLEITNCNCNIDKSKCLYCLKIKKLINYQ